IVLAVWIVTGHTRHLGRAAAEQEVACLARVRRAAARHGIVAPAAFPRPRVLAEQHGVATRARAVDPLRARGLAPVRADRAHEWAAQLERRQHGRVSDMLRRAAVAGLAAHADLHEIRTAE